MIKSKIIKRITSVVLSLSIAVTLINFSMFSASAFDTSYISKDGMALGYSIINGYTKMYLRSRPENFNGKAAVYSGVDITNPYVLTVGGWYVLTRKINIDRLLNDNDYAITNFTDFNGYLSKRGVGNDKSKLLQSSLTADKIKTDAEMTTLGLYIINSDKEYLNNLIDNNDDVDFVLINGEVPENMKDLNFDGKTDREDAALIQQYLAGSLDIADDDENAYVLFASDYNQDKSIDIQDVTDMLFDFS